MDFSDKNGENLEHFWLWNLDYKQSPKQGSQFYKIFPKKSAKIRTKIFSFQYKNSFAVIGSSSVRRSKAANAINHSLKLKSTSVLTIISIFYHPSPKQEDELCFLIWLVLFFNDFSKNTQKNSSFLWRTGDKNSHYSLFWFKRLHIHWLFSTNLIFLWIKSQNKTD